MRLSIPRMLSLAVLSVPGLLVAQEPLFVQDVGTGYPAFSNKRQNAGSGRIADQFKLNRQAVIDGVTWHGIVQDPLFDPTTTPMTFLIEFFDERGGRPSGPPVHSVLVAPVVREIGLTVTRGPSEGFAIYEFATQLMPPLGARPRDRVWVSIARWEPEPGNQFLWCRSPSSPGATYATIANGVFTLRKASKTVNSPSRAGRVPGNFAFQLFGNE